MSYGANERIVGLQRQLQIELDIALQAVVQSRDPIFQTLALSRTVTITQEAKRIAQGDILFSNTETWRAAYESLLANLSFSSYFSVAWVRSVDYWRDTPGRNSIRLNYELIDRGLQIERIAILSESLWSRGKAPDAGICTWLEEQHYRGISLFLVREQDLKSELDLVRDFGIYGDRATGEQRIDDNCRTISFRLSFAASRIEAAINRWKRLQVFAIPCAQALDIG
jgi:hypothetical protein